MRDFRLSPSDPKPSFQPHIMFHPSMHSRKYHSPLDDSSSLEQYVHSPPPTLPHICVLGYNALPCLSGLAKSFLLFNDPLKQQPTKHPCPYNQLLTSYYYFNLILPLIRIHCINVPPSSATLFLRTWTKSY